MHIGSSCYKLFSMDIIEKNHLRFDEYISHTEDGLFVFDYLKCCAGLYYEPIPLWNILERSGSATTSGYTRKMLSSIDAIDQMISRPGNSPDAIAHLEAFRAHEALRVLGLGIDSGDMTEGDRRALHDALADGKVDRARPVSYTHLDVYKRQALVFFVALLLTTKRAHLLCGVFAVGFVYLISNNQHWYLKAIGVGALVVLAVAVLAPLIPGIEATIERLTTTFSSNTSFEDNVNNRTYLWDYALNGLAQSPVFGHGWTSYCYRWPDGVTITYMAHNELLNLLYETGYVGTAIVLLGCAASLLLTLHTIVLTDDGHFKAYLRLSLCVQIFFLTYAFTSGALFTTIPNLITYFLAVAIMASIRWDVLERDRTPRTSHGGNR